MKLVDLGGPVKAHTSGGSITATNLRSEADLSTSGGRIKVDSISGNSKLKTSGGSISATGVNGPLDAKTSGGSITASFPGGIDADTVLKTSGGGITAKLPQGEQFYLNARTSGGGANTEFPITMTGELKRSQTAEGPSTVAAPYSSFVPPEEASTWVTSKSADSESRAHQTSVTLIHPLPRGF